MSRFRLDPVPRLSTLRVLHGDRPLAVALVTIEPDLRLALFPVEFDRPPPPLTGEVKMFDSLEEIRAHLGIKEDAA